MHGATTGGRTRRDVDGSDMTPPRKRGRALVDFCMPRRFQDAAPQARTSGMKCPDACLWWCDVGGCGARYDENGGAGGGRYATGPKIRTFHWATFSRNHQGTGSAICWNSVWRGASCWNRVWRGQVCWKCVCRGRFCWFSVLRASPNGKPADSPLPNGKPADSPSPNEKPTDSPSPNGIPCTQPSPNGKPADSLSPDEIPAGDSLAKRKSVRSLAAGS